MKTRIKSIVGWIGKIAAALVFAVIVLGFLLPEVRRIYGTETDDFLRSSHAVYELKVDPFASVDKAFDARLPAHVVYNPPERLRLGEEATLRVVVGIDQSVADLKKAFSNSSHLETATVRVSPSVTATLSGPGFEIHPRTPASQAITRREPTSWTWDISPTKSGLQHIQLTLSATVVIDGEPTSLSPKILDRTIIVEVTPWQTMGRYFEGKEIVGGVLASIIAAFILWMSSRLWHVKRVGTPVAARPEDNERTRKLRSSSPAPTPTEVRDGSTPANAPLAATHNKQVQPRRTEEDPGNH